MSHLHRLARTVALLTALSSAGCSLFRPDGWDDSKRVMDIPVRNFAIETPPYIRVMGYPFPDRAWIRERYAECEPWQVGDNGCSGPTPATTTLAPVSPPSHQSRTNRRRPVGS